MGMNISPITNTKRSFAETLAKGTVVNETLTKSTVADYKSIGETLAKGAVVNETLEKGAVADYKTIGETLAKGAVVNYFS